MILAIYFKFLKNGKNVRNLVGNLHWVVNYRIICSTIVLRRKWIQLPCSSCTVNKMRSKYVIFCQLVVGVFLLYLFLVHYTPFNGVFMFDLCKRNDDDSNKMKRERQKKIVSYLSLTSSDFRCVCGANNFCFIISR